MTSIVRGIAWIGIFIGICVAPLVFALMSTNQPGQGFLTDFSVALGFVGLALMGIEFALVARVRTVAEPFGTDAVIDFHRQIGYTGLIFVLIHVALSADWSQANPFTPSNTPLRVWFGGVATAALVLLVASSVWRRRLRLSYELWQVLHAVLAVIAVLAALVHVLLVDYYVDSVWKQVLWSTMTAAFVWLLVWVRLLRPLRIRRRPWTVERITPERDRTTVVTLRPTGHDGLRFETRPVRMDHGRQIAVLGDLTPVLVLLERRDARQRRDGHQGRRGLHFQRRNRQARHRGPRGRATRGVLDRPV